MEIISMFTSYPPEEQQRILDKYKNAVGTIYKNIDQNELFKILYSLEYAFKYLNENYKEVSKDIKAWCMVALLRAIKNNTITNNEDIESIIIRCIEHFKSDVYNEYLSEIDLYNNEYSRDIEYLNKLII